MISSDVVVLTKTELEEKERAAFRRGVERGRFEERMDVNARPASGEREEYRKAVDDLNKLTDADLRRGKPAPSPAPAEELVKNLRKLNVCRRCDCSDCEREGAGELHDHVCTNGPGCVDTVPKLRRWRRGAVILAGQAAAEIRRLTEEGHNARETSRLLLIQRDEANTRAEQAERERDEACKKTSLSDKLAFNNSERAAHYQAALPALLDAIEGRRG